MIITVADNITPSSDKFNNSGHAVAYLAKFYHVVDVVDLEGNAGLAVGYYILNRTKDKEDYNPPEILIKQECNPDNIAKFQKIISDITKHMAKKYNRKFV